MLLELRIENFAIVDHLDIRFGPGLVTFTGETGAGKSIILDAIMAVMGSKAEPHLIRAGAERALVEATFELPETTRQAILEVLAGEDLLDDERFLSLSREIRREGRSVARVNGRSVNLGLMREIGSYLVDIHGQSEHLSLLMVNNHLGLLDRYARSDPYLTPYQQTYRKYAGLRRELHQLKMSQEETGPLADLLNFQTAEIRSARLQPDEEDQLVVERDRLANAGSLAELVQQGLACWRRAPRKPPRFPKCSGRLCMGCMHSAGSTGANRNWRKMQSELRKIWPSWL